MGQDVPLVKWGPVFQLPPVLGHHMVVQRDREIPVWGLAAPDREVTVQLGDQRQAVLAGPDGRWSVRLPPLPAGGPLTLILSTEGSQLALTNILVGEVWLGSGQSNMSLPIGKCTADDPVLAALAADFWPRVRVFQSGVESRRGWRAADAAGLPGFSALLFAFGVSLQRELGVPVGLIVAAEGGSASGQWVEPAHYAADAGCRQAVAAFAETYTEADVDKAYAYQQALWRKGAAFAEANGRPLPPPPVRLNPGDAPFTIGGLHEQYIRPLVPGGIRGVLWDQGEDGTGICGLDQPPLMAALIAGWRREWGQGEFPFLIVQKPNGGGCALESNATTRLAAVPAPLPPAPPGDGAGRAGYLEILKNPATFLVPSSDLGGGKHPANKSGYGARAAQVALGGVYGRAAAISGPVYRSHAVEGGVVRIRFAHAGRGLVFRGDKLQGFALAGPDGVFHWAAAEIEPPATPEAAADTVRVTCDQVPVPVAVEYAWAQEHPWANLFNGEGLPAMTFRAEWEHESKP